MKREVYDLARRLVLRDATLAITQAHVEEEGMEWLLGLISGSATEVADAIVVHARSAEIIAALPAVRAEQAAIILRQKALDESVFGNFAQTLGLLQDNADEGLSERVETEDDLAKLGDIGLDSHDTALFVALVNAADAGDRVSVLAAVAELFSSLKTDLVFAELPPAPELLVIED